MQRRWGIIICGDQFSAESPPQILDVQQHPLALAEQQSLDTRQRQRVGNYF